MLPDLSRLSLRAGPLPPLEEHAELADDTDGNYPFDATYPHTQLSVGYLLNPNNAAAGMVPAMYNPFRFFEAAYASFSLYNHALHIPYPGSFVLIKRNPYTAEGFINLGNAVVLIVTPSVARYMGYDRYITTVRHMWDNRNASDDARKHPDDASLRERLFFSDAVDASGNVNSEYAKNVKKFMDKLPDTAKQNVWVMYRPSPTALKRFDLPSDDVRQHTYMSLGRWSIKSRKEYNRDGVQVEDDSIAPGVRTVTELAPVETIPGGADRLLEYRQRMGNTGRNDANKGSALHGEQRYRMKLDVKSKKAAITALGTVNDDLQEAAARALVNLRRDERDERSRSSRSRSRSRSSNDDPEIVALETIVVDDDDAARQADALAGGPPSPSHGSDALLVTEN